MAGHLASSMKLIIFILGTQQSQVVSKYVIIYFLLISLINEARIRADLQKGCTLMSTPSE